MAKSKYKDPYFIGRVTESGNIDVIVAGLPTKTKAVAWVKARVRHPMRHPDYVIFKVVGKWKMITNVRAAEVTEDTRPTEVVEEEQTAETAAPAIAAANLKIDLLD